ncbi:MAG: type I methionyl aminopeptidase [Christensenellaceae bacterium]|jgi:methionyl aminopeptidase|nr:type I methionyl aminopeptidase [Christensenellaceae bacterium]
MISYKSPQEIAKMQKAGEITFATLKAVKAAVCPGISTLELDAIAEETIRRAGAVPNFKGYNGFPGTICASLNDVVVHGIPARGVVLREGDILSVDCGAIWEGYHGDAARTYPVGAVASDAALLIERTRDSFYEGLRFAEEGFRVGDISAAIQAYCEGFGYGVVRVLCGHGIGQEMHEDPEVPNFGRAGKGLKLRAGLTLAIEPMITAGGYAVYRAQDGWAYHTRDHSLAAHYENTICVREEGPPLILTIPSGEDDI